MQDAFKPQAGRGIGEYPPGKLVAPQLAVRRQDSGPERFPDLGQGRLARFNHLARQIVGVHDGDPARAKQLGGGGLAHANATG
jgi:hypothetical protein